MLFIYTSSSWGHSLGLSQGERVVLIHWYTSCPLDYRQVFLPRIWKQTNKQTKNAQFLAMKGNRHMGGHGQLLVFRATGWVGLWCIYWERLKAGGEGDDR